MPDKNDRHVLAAAIKCDAQAIITFNLKDFPQSSLKQYYIEAIGPDEFVLRLINQDLGLVCKVVKTHRMSLKKPPKLIDEYLNSLKNCGLLNSVKQLREHADNL